MEFREFHLYDDKLFTVDNGNKFNKNAMSFKSPSVNFVGRSASNNGITAIVDRVLGVEPYKGGSLTLALGGSIGCCFLQEQDFYTGQNLAVLMPKWGMSTEIKLYIATCISKVAKNSYKAFSDELNKHIHTDFMFKLPAKSITLIDYDCIEHIGGGLDNMSNIDTSSWKEFRIGDLFEKIKVSKLNYKVKDLPTEPSGVYCLPALTAGVENQGLSCYVPSNGATILMDVISVSANGANTGAMFWQDKEFTVLQDAYAIELVDKCVTLTKEIALFMIACMQKVIKGNFDWSNKAGWDKIKELKIKLPVTTVYEPDFDYMEKYVSELEQERVSELEQYLKVSGLDDYELTEEEMAFLQSTREVVV